ncbi:MAG: S8 family serine peptidase [Flavobacteriales bacterium]|nr:S8 family serine peptidase [Flavobacteriales bacterium]
MHGQEDSTEIDSLNSSKRIQLYGIEGVFGQETSYLSSLSPLGYDIDGSGQTIGLWDQYHAFVEHVELSSSVSIGEDVTPTFSDHATDAASILTGDGLLEQAIGIAPGAQVVSFDADNLLTEMYDFAPQINVSSHSHGGVSNIPDVGSQYTENCYCTDWIILENDEYLAVIANGNHGEDYNVGVMNDYATCKNCLSVGAVTFDNLMPLNHEDASLIERVDYSSFGPTVDGRIKPDIMGVGHQMSATYLSPDHLDSYDLFTGTSCATPSVAGSLTLLQSLNQELYGNHLKAAMLKGLVLHSAIDIEQEGPDYESGWGLINIENAAQLIIHQNDACDSFGMEYAVHDGSQNYEYEFYLSKSQDFKATLAYMDDLPEYEIVPCDWNNNLGEPTIDQNNILQNDLDMRLINLDSGEQFFPYILNPSSPSSPACNSPECNNGVIPDNDLDNVEQIFVPNLPLGNYKLVVSLEGDLTQYVLTQGQPFALIYGDLNAPSFDLNLTDAIDIDVTGGMASLDFEPYDFSILEVIWRGENYLSIGESATGLSPGVYSVCVEYSFGCVHLQECKYFEISCDDILDYELDFEISVSNAKNFDGGTIVLNIPDDSEVIGIEWSNQINEIIAEDVYSLNGVDPGNYTVDIYTSQGCFGMNYGDNVTMNCANSVSDFNIENLNVVSPFGNSLGDSGSIEVEFVGSYLDLSIEWLSTLDETFSGSFIEFDEPGTFEVTVTDPYCGNQQQMMVEVNCYQCLFDFNQDGLINSSDQLYFFSQYGNSCAAQPCPCLADSNGDGAINSSDFLDMLSSFGQPCE